MKRWQPAADITCSNLALLVDGDTGARNAVNVYHLVEHSDAGAADIMIEDRCGRSVATTCRAKI